MSLEVWTARVSTRDPDRIDITRKTGHRAFAPSWNLLGPFLARRKTTAAISDSEWRDYVRDYTNEMRRSYQLYRVKWDWLLSKPRAVLVCYCTDAARCHRRVLAGILVRLGAEDRGELP